MSALGWEAAKAHIHAAGFSKRDNDPGAILFSFTPGSSARGSVLGCYILVL